MVTAARIRVGGISGGHQSDAIVASRCWLAGGICRDIDDTHCRGGDDIPLSLLLILAAG